MLVGAGDLGREIVSWVSTNPELSDRYEWEGVIDDGYDAQTFSGSKMHIPFLGRIQDYQPNPHCKLVMGIASAQAKLSISKALQASGGIFETLIHPSAIIGANVKIGTGTVIMPGAVISCDASLGEMVLINSCSSIGHDVVIGDGTTVSGNCDLAGYVKVGVGVFFGSRSGAIPKTTIEDFAKVAAGSTVFRRVKAGQTVIGVPAKLI